MKRKKIKRYIYVDINCTEETINLTICVLLAFSEQPNA